MLFGLAAAGTSFNYCSISYSAVVSEELSDYFLEVFKGFDVPLSPTCPFVNID